MKEEHKRLGFQIIDFCTNNYALCALFIGGVVFALATYLSSWLQPDASVIGKLVQVTIELLGMSTVVFGALEMIQRTYITLVTKNNELAEIARKLPELNVTDSKGAKRADSAAKRLRPIVVFLGALEGRYVRVRRMFFYGFWLILLVDFGVQLCNYLAFDRISSSPYPVVRILFSFEIALLAVALTVLVFVVRIAVGYAEKTDQLVAQMP